MRMRGEKAAKRFFRLLTGIKQGLDAGLGEDVAGIGHIARILVHLLPHRNHDEDREHESQPRDDLDGGTCCVPIALRTIESTTEIFTNEVSITTRNGASARNPRTMTITTGFAT